MPKSEPVFCVTCEHATNAIPEEYRCRFAWARAELNSHRGYDPGAVEIAAPLARSLGAPLFRGKISRLLVELNRSIGHRRLWSEFTQTLSAKEKACILEGWYRPYRREVERWIRYRVQQGRQVIHLSVHTFTPILNGQTRSADIGLLYDPKRWPERAYCREWKDRLKAHDRELRVRSNYPYRGTADGFTTALRKAFGEDQYLGIELEVNQALKRIPEWYPPSRPSAKLS